MMYEFVNVCWIDGTKYQRKFKVLRFLFETDTAWFFKVQAISEKVHGKIYEISRPEKDLGFPKRKISDDGVAEELIPLPFYNKLRNVAILSGALSLQGDDSPALSDDDIFHF